MEKGFHANLVIAKKNSDWNGFAFFGMSTQGKTPLSFALATRLLLKDCQLEIRIFDDFFELSGDTWTSH